MYVIYDVNIHSVAGGVLVYMASGLHATALVSSKQSPLSESQDASDSLSEHLKLKNFSGGACPQPPQMAVGYALSYVINPLHITLVPHMNKIPGYATDYYSHVIAWSCGL